MEQFNPGVYKFASASLTDHALIEKVRQTGQALYFIHGDVYDGQRFGWR
jgi:sialic acid synthase SpsE